MDLWKGVTKDDVVITLGFDAGEYSLNLGKINAGHVWHFTDLRDAYGHKQGEFRHRVANEYRLVRGDIGFVLEEILKRLPSAMGERPRYVHRRPSRSTAARSRARTRARAPSTPWSSTAACTRCGGPDSIGFDDVCTAYKDRQYVAQRPSQNIRFFTTHDGSAMGGGFGLGVGAKAGEPVAPHVRLHRRRVLASLRRRARRRGEHGPARLRREQRRLRDRRQGSRGDHPRRPEAPVPLEAPADRLREGGRGARLGRRARRAGPLEPRATSSTRATSRRAARCSSRSRSTRIRCSVSTRGSTT